MQPVMVAQNLYYSVALLGFCFCFVTFNLIVESSLAYDYFVNRFNSNVGWSFSSIHTQVMNLPLKYFKIKYHFIVILPHLIVHIKILWEFTPSCATAILNRSNMAPGEPQHIWRGVQTENCEREIW